MLNRLILTLVCVKISAAATRYLTAATAAKRNPQLVLVVDIQRVPASSPPDPEVPASSPPDPVVPDSPPWGFFADELADQDESKEDY